MIRTMMALLTAVLLTAAVPVHAEDDGRGVGPDSVAIAADRERQRRQEIEALQAIVRELHELNRNVEELARQVRDVSRALERRR